MACGGKVCLIGPTMLRTVAGSVVCGGEVFAMGSLGELIITTSTLLVCYCIFSCLFRVKYWSLDGWNSWDCFYFVRFLFDRIFRGFLHAIRNHGRKSKSST